MHSISQFSSLRLVPLLSSLLLSSPALALTCYPTTPPAQAPVAADCEFILNKLPAITFRPDAQRHHDNLTFHMPLQAQPYQLPAHFRHGSCGMAIRANVPGGGPNPPQPGAILPAGGSAVGDTCIPVRFTGQIATTFWGVARDAGQDLLNQCVNQNQQAGIEWGTFLPGQGELGNDDEAGPSGSGQDPSGSGAGPSDYGAGPSGSGAGPSDYEAGPSGSGAGTSDDPYGSGEGPSGSGTGLYGSGGSASGSGQVPFGSGEGASGSGQGAYGSGQGASGSGAAYYGPSKLAAGSSKLGASNASLIQRGYGSSLQPKGFVGSLEPRGVGSSSQTGSVEALFGVWIAGSDMPRDSLANVYDV